MIEYYLSGPGADKPPFNIFMVDHGTGFVRITEILDREKYPFYNVSLSLNKLQACNVLYILSQLGEWARFPLVTRLYWMALSFLYTYLHIS